MNFLDDMDEDKTYALYIQPQLMKYLRHLDSTGLPRPLAFLRESRLEVTIGEDGRVKEVQMLVPEVVEGAENLHCFWLGGDLWRLTMKQNRLLADRGSIRCKGGKVTRLAVYEEEDVEFLKECGVYAALENMVSRLEYGEEDEDDFFI